MSPTNSIKSDDTNNGSNVSSSAAGNDLFRWEVDAVCKWLEQIGLKEFEAKFRAEKIDGFALERLTDEDFKDLGVPMGPRKRIMAALKNGGRLPTTTTTTTTATTTSPTMTMSPKNGGNGVFARLDLHTAMLPMSTVTTKDNSSVDGERFSSQSSSKSTASSVDDFVDLQRLVKRLSICHSVEALDQTPESDLDNLLVMLESAQQQTRF
jgi:hypothetical protein